MIPFESGSLYTEPGCCHCLPPGSSVTRNPVTMVEIWFWIASAHPCSCLESLWARLCVCSDAGHLAAGWRKKRELTVAGYCYVPDTNDLIYFSQLYELVIISVLLIPNLKKLSLLFKAIYLVITKLWGARQSLAKTISHIIFLYSKQPSKPREMLSWNFLSMSIYLVMF